jgi:CheY-like chemotaxis protein
MVSGKQIILVDDEPYVTAMLSRKLTALGHTIRICSDGQEAFDTANQLPPDAIVSDYQMPILNGFEMCIKLKSNPLTARVPVVLLTARGHHFNDDDLAKTNIRCVLAKPFSARDVIATLDKIFNAAPNEMAVGNGAEHV